MPKITKKFKGNKLVISILPDHPERLKLGIKILENLPENGRFNMDVWGTHASSHEPCENNYCGTTACALGWMALDRRMNKLGLKSSWIEGRLYIDYKDNDFTDAAARFFGITALQAEEVFLVRGPRKKVINKLKRLLKGDQKTYLVDIEDDGSIDIVQLSN